MVAPPELFPSADTRTTLRERGAWNASRCYQCGTCSSVCDVAGGDFTFPRRQMLFAQWGLGKQLANDPSVWLCHGCNDCLSRCPRDAKPGDVMQAARSVAVEELAFPSFMGRLVGRARTTWPVLLGVPILFWALFVVAFFLLRDEASLASLRQAAEYGFDRVVPHSVLYAVFFPIAGFVALAWWIGGSRFWRGMEGAERRTGKLLPNLAPTFTEILSHQRFTSCAKGADTRRWGHLLLVSGFLGAAIASGLLVLAIYVMHEDMPLSLWHPFKILGNLSAVLLVAGGAMLLWDRLRHRPHVGLTTAFDGFFLGLVVLVIATGVGAEVARLQLDPVVGCVLYIVHLGAVMCLFLTTPFSKFAHILYRTLAMVHERMVSRVGYPR